MEPYSFTLDQNCQLTIEMPRSDKITGHFDIQLAEFRHTYDIVGGCVKSSETSYDIFFKVNWNKHDETDSFSIFSGKIIPTANTPKLELNWFLSCKITEEVRTGIYKLSNQFNSINTGTKTLTEMPFPDTLSVKNNFVIM